jgi:hypothetical protein
MHRGIMMDTRLLLGEYIILILKSLIPNYNYYNIRSLGTFLYELFEQIVLEGLTDRRLGLFGQFTFCSRFFQCRHLSCDASPESDEPCSQAHPTVADPCAHRG